MRTMTTVHKTMSRVISCLLFYFGLLLPISHAQNVQLEVLNSAQGLSQGMVYDIVQDRNGFIWFATRGGLNRYDGYGFKVWKNDPFNPYSISDNTIQVLLEDRRGWLWLGTENNGIDVFDPQTSQFFHLSAAEGGLSNGDVNALTEAPDGAIWAGTSLGLNRVQLDRFPTNTANLNGVARVEHFFWEPKNTLNISANLYEALLCTPEGILWVGTPQQVYRYQLNTGKREIVPCQEPNPQAGGQTASFARGPDGSVWLGQSKRVIRFRGDKMDVFPFPASTQPFRTYLTFDQSGNLYVGRRKFVYLFPQEDLTQNKPIEPRIFCDFPPIGVIGSTQLLCDRNGLIWMGTNGYGVRKYNLVNQNFQHFLKGISTRRLLADRAGQIWAWDASAIIKRVDEQSKTSAESFLPGNDFFNHDLLQAKDGSYWFLGEFRAHSTQGQLIHKNDQTGLLQAYPCPITLSIYSQLLEDRQGNIWIFGPESNFARFDVKTKQFKTFSFATVTGFKEASFAMLEDLDRHLWMGTPHGLLRGVLDAKGQMQFKLYHCKPEDPGSLSSNVVLSLCDDPADPKRFIWVGTRGGGLNLLDKKTGKCEHFTMKNGLPDDVIYGILPDQRGNLWLSTNSGLSKFTPQSEHFENYSVADGLQDNEFNTVSHAKAHNGRLVFGGVNGITAFFPEKISPHDQPTTVFITALKTNNKIALPGAGILNKNIEYTESVQIPYAQNQLSLDFVAMDFATPNKNQFRYRLKGADKAWVESTTAHSVNYSNLAPGRYEFEVLSGGAHGVWSEQASRKLIIQVLPPWWRSLPAYAMYVLLTLLGVYQFIQWRVRQHQARSQREFEKREIERIQALEQMKSNFFTNITHELRTPLTLVIEPLRQILNQPAAENWLNKVQIAERSGSKLLHLVNQLLDLAKLEGGAMPLDLRWHSIDDVLIHTAETFAEPALSKQIHFELKVSDPPLGEAYFDRDKLEKIISNLLSNALKYTPVGGMVSLGWDAENQGDKRILRIAVKDTGSGIPLEQQTHVFERFYTLDQASNGQASTGVGLSLCKELAEIMGGQIDLESETGQGALFRVSLPLPAISAPQKQQNINGTPTTASSKINQFTATEQTLVLVVEDDHELRNFLTQTLQAQYQVISAEQGKQALTLAQEHTPDVIISDLAMPEMDGFELLQCLKKDLITSHIPVILLTAKSGLESRLIGLQYGAEAYLQKPFHTEELQAWIYTLLKNRRQLQESFVAKQALSAVPSDAVKAPIMSLLDQEFLQRLEQIVQQEMENENLNVEDLARLMFISRSQLHRKVIALTGLSSTELVRKWRLDHAMHLIKTEGGKIADIAQRVGFRNVKYFSTAFKEHFGKSPSEV